MAPARRGAHGQHVRCVYIPVVGMVGVGKSTFTREITGDKSIRVGNDEDMGGVTRSVQHYICRHTYRGVEYEIRFIDTPGFNDELCSDAQNLTALAIYLNNIYQHNGTFAGILYLHDMTHAKVGGEEKKNLKMLRGLLGHSNWTYCTVVTTKWHCGPYEPQKARERTLAQRHEYFGEMLNAPNPAKMERFHPLSKARALAIVEPMLERAFVPKLCQQMVEGKMKLRETDAGKPLHFDARDRPRSVRKSKKNQAAMALLEKKHSDSHEAHVKLLQQHSEELKKHKEHQIRVNYRWLEGACWVARIIIIGGGITATIFTMGPGAAAFSLIGPVETVSVGLRRRKKEKLEKLKKEFGGELPEEKTLLIQDHAQQAAINRLIDDTGESGGSVSGDDDDDNDDDDIGPEVEIDI